MQIAPMIQAKITAGPAAMRPSWAPNSQPEPMIDPIEAHIRPIRPTSRFSAKLRFRPDGDEATSTDIDVSLSRRSTPDRPAPVPLPDPSPQQPGSKPAGA